MRISTETDLVSGRTIIRAFLLPFTHDGISVPTTWQTCNAGIRVLPQGGFKNRRKCRSRRGNEAEVFLASKSALDH